MENPQRRLGTIWEELRSKFFWRVFAFFLLIILPIWLLHLWFTSERGRDLENVEIPKADEEVLVELDIH